MPIPALLAAAPGLIKAGASLFGGKKRRAAERSAQAKFDQQRSALENFQFENPYANQENVFEDATINQQAAQFQAQQNDQKLAQGLDAFTQSGGGGGGAQAFAQAALGAAQGASADIARQEQGNQARALSEQSRLNQQEAQGAATLQNQQHGQLQQQFNLAQQDLAQAQAARKQATADLVGGLTSAVGSFAGAGGFGGGAGKAAAAAGGAGGPVGAANAVVNPETGLGQDGYGYDDLGYTNLDDLDGGFPRLKDKDMLHNSALKRLYGDHGMMSPLKQNGEKKKDYSRSRKRANEASRLLQVYGGEEGKGQAHLKEAFNKNFEQYKKQFPDATRESFATNVWRDYDPEGGGEITPYQQAYQDASLEAERLGDEEFQAFRAGQDEAFANLSPGERYNRTRDFVSALRGEGKYKQAAIDAGFNNIPSHLQKLLDKYDKDPIRPDPKLVGELRTGVEKYYGDVGRREYLNPHLAALYAPSNAPTKRMKTPLYRMFKMKWKGMYK